MSLRLRLGAAIMPDGHTCSYCGEAIMDINSHYNDFCAYPETTRGHNGVRDVVLSLAIKADSAAETEPVSVISSRLGLRSADVRTARAVQGTIAALDVGVTAPTATEGDTDCTERYRQAELNKYRRYLPELSAHKSNTHIGPATSRC